MIFAKKAYMFFSGRNKEIKISSKQKTRSAGIGKTQTGVPQSNQKVSGCTICTKTSRCHM